MGNDNSILEGLAGMMAHSAELEERLNTLMMYANEEVGWEAISTWGSTSEPVSLKTLKDTSEILSDMVATHPLFQRGTDLRHFYCYARGVSYTHLKPKSQAAIDNPFNNEALFSNQATKQGIRTRGTDGNRFILKNNSTGDLYVIPLNQIADAYVDPDDRSRILYIKRAWTVNQVSKTEWYPTANLRDSKMSLSKSIKNPLTRQTEPVQLTHTMFHMAYNRPAGETWGIPDYLAAMLWAKAYSAYLKDNATLVKAYSRIAFQVSSGTATGQTNASARLLANTAIGATGVTDNATDITAMAPQGSNVNFGNGRPLASLVASSFGVSVVSLLSDPGTGGSYGVAETLDPPTLLMAQNLQADEKVLYERILRSYLNADAEVSFPSIDQDPPYRAMQSIAQATAQGLLFRDEARDAAIRLLDIEEPKAGMPVADGFNAWTDPHPPKPVAPIVMPGQAPAPGKPNNPVPGQGKSGAAGSIDQGTNNDARAAGEPGTSTK